MSRTYSLKTIMTVDDLEFEKIDTQEFWSKPTYGNAINVIAEDEKGRMYAFSEDECLITQINFNPFTGEPARVKRE